MPVAGTFGAEAAPRSAGPGSAPGKQTGAGGPQCCPADCQAGLCTCEIRVSMGGRGNCHDRSGAETFSKTVGAEPIRTAPRQARGRAESAIAKCIGRFRSPAGRQPPLGDLTPPPPAGIPGTPAESHPTIKGKVQQLLTGWSKGQVSRASPPSLQLFAMAVAILAAVPQIALWHTDMLCGRWEDGQPHRQQNFIGLCRFEGPGRVVAPRHAADNQPSGRTRFRGLSLPSATGQPPAFGRPFQGGCTGRLLQASRPEGTRSSAARLSSARACSANRARQAQEAGVRQPEGCRS